MQKLVIPAKLQTAYKHNKTKSSQQLPPKIVFMLDTQSFKQIQLAKNLSIYLHVFIIRIPGLGLQG